MDVCLGSDKCIVTLGVKIKVVRGKRMKEIRIHLYTFSILQAGRGGAPMARQGVERADREWQTNNGREFREGHQCRGVPSTFKAL